MSGDFTDGGKLKKFIYLLKYNRYFDKMLYIKIKD